MGIKVDWLNEKQQIIVFDLVGRWTWQEMITAIETCHTMIESVDYQVRTVFDASRSIGWPSNPLTNMRKTTEYQHPRSSTVAIVGIGSFLQPILDLFQRIYRFTNPNGVFFFKTREEAASYLEKQIEQETVEKS